MPRTALDPQYFDSDLSLPPRSVSANAGTLQRWQEHQNNLQEQQNQLDAQSQHQLATTAGTDASSWTTMPQYAGKSFDQAPPEARQHFLDAYGGLGQTAWNGAQIQHGEQNQQLDQQQQVQTQQVDQTTGKTMANDATQWALNPAYAGKSFADAPVEARQHFVDAYGGNIAQVPTAWNNAQRTVTGDPNIGNVAKQDVAFDPALTGDDALKGMKANEASFSKRLAGYELPISSLSRFPADQKARIIAGASAYDPTFDAKEYPARQALQTGFKNGPQAQAITSLNRVMGHLDDLDKSSKLLNNYKSPDFNAAKNLISNHSGSNAVTSFNTNADAVASELAKIFKGTGAATNQEIQEWRKSFDPNMSPEQLQGSIDKTVKLIGSQTEALRHQYEDGFKKPKDRKWLDPKAREVYARFGGNPDEVDPVVGGQQPQSDNQKPATSTPNQAPAQSEFPKQGDIRKGYQFQGGNPADPKSWKVVG